jgi:hypothetical protein
LGGDAIAGDDKNTEAMLKASELRSVNLFGVFRHPLGTPVNFNPAILAVAEKVDQLPGIKRGKDYLFHARKFLESGQLKIDFTKDYYTRQLGGLDFDAMELEISLHGVLIKEAYYTTILKGYALTFIVSFTNDEERQVEEKVLGSLTFHQ